MCTGKSDFHALQLEYGECARFYGNQCRHHTLPNLTEKTRCLASHVLCPATHASYRTAAPPCTRLLTRVYAAVSLSLSLAR